MAIHSCFKLLDEVIFFLKLSLELFHVTSFDLSSVSCRSLPDNLLAYFMLRYDFLHLSKGSIACNTDLLSELRNSLRIDLSLLVHLPSQVSRLLFLASDSLILVIKHILQSFNRLVGSVSHFLLFLIIGLGCFDPMLGDGIFEHLVLAQVLVTHLPFLEGLNRGFFFS